eukprot:TRINITY_DN2491_c0_g1_i1.p1 TRINITY_DN2491_c0_g1~~TRINITY_DN2491_c0_g1_i1.p1  ORF type:complete len:616 (+),score=247.16 TRINITY_DN2491_c0_g1_i1:49-1848(+)
MNLKALGVLSLVFLALPWLFSTQLAVLGALALSSLLLWVVSNARPPPGLRPERPLRALLHDKFSEDKLPEKVDVIVIGSGMGSLTTAAMLARTNKRVVVLEQHPDVAGGSTHSFNLKGYKFDSGLHYTVPWNSPLLQLAALKKEDQVPPCEMMGDDDGVFDYVHVGEEKRFGLRHREAHLQEIYDMFPEEKKAIDDFVRDAGYGIQMSKFIIIGRLIPRWLQDFYWSLVPKKWLEPQLKTGEEMVKSYTTNKRLQALLCSLWMDSGGRPDISTFMMTGCVFRGLPMEGGCYPRGGSEVLGAALVPVIEEWGGRVLIDAKVGEINFNAKGEACGVTLANGTSIDADMVVSGCGYLNTFKKLVPKPIVEKYKIPTDPCKTSCGFVMANIGMKGTAEELGITNANLWYVPVDKDGDMFEAMRTYYADPIKAGEPPIMVTFPSVKDQSADKNANKTTCQMLIFAEYPQWKEWENEPYLNRGDDYDALKKDYEKMMLKILHRFYPKTEGKVDMIDISTPLSINHHLGTWEGTSVGLEISSDRFFKPEVARELDPVTRIPNLYLTGTDIVLPGVCMAQIAGVVTTFRICGFMQSVRFILQSVLLA